MFRTILMIALVWTAPAFAQAAPCAKRADILKHLSEKYQEIPLGMGLTGSGQVLEILAASGGSWSVVVTSPAGVTCALAAGEAWSGSVERRIGSKDHGPEIW